MDFVADMVDLMDLMKLVLDFLIVVLVMVKLVNSTSRSFLLSLVIALSSSSGCYPIGLLAVLVVVLFLGLVVESLLCAGGCGLILNSVCCCFVVVYLVVWFVWLNGRASMTMDRLVCWYAYLALDVEQTSQLKADIVEISQYTFTVVGNHCVWVPFVLVLLVNSIECNFKTISIGEFMRIRLSFCL